MKLLLLAAFFVLASASSLYRNRNISVNNDEGSIYITSPSGRNVAITRGPNGQRSVEITISGPNFPTKTIEIGEQYEGSYYGGSPAGYNSLDEETRLKRGSKKGQGQGQSEILYSILREYQGVVDQSAYQRLLSSVEKAVSQGEVNPQILSLLNALDQIEEAQEFNQFISQFAQYGRNGVGSYQGQYYPGGYGQGNSYNFGGNYGLPWFLFSRQYSQQYPYYRGQYQYGSGRQYYPSSQSYNPFYQVFGYTSQGQQPSYSFQGQQPSYAFQRQQPSYTSQGQQPSYAFQGQQPSYTSQGQQQQPSYSAYQQFLQALFGNQYGTSYGGYYGRNQQYPYSSVAGYSSQYQGQYPGQYQYPYSSYGSQYYPSGVSSEGFGEGYQQSFLPYSPAYYNRFAQAVY